MDPQTVQLDCIQVYGSRSPPIEPQIDLVDILWIHIRSNWTFYGSTNWSKWIFRGSINSPLPFAALAEIEGALFWDALSDVHGRAQTRNARVCGVGLNRRTALAAQTEGEIVENCERLDYRERD